MDDGHLWAEHVGAQDQPETYDLWDLLMAFTPAWHDRAACRGRTDLMFPKRRTSRAQIDEALALCGICEVRTECRDAGREMAHGIWGGHLREPNRSRRATVGAHLGNGEWWHVEDLAFATGRPVAHVHAQIRKLTHRWTIEADDRADGVWYRRQF